MAFEPAWQPVAGVRSSKDVAPKGAPGSASEISPRARRRLTTKGSSEDQAGPAPRGSTLDNSRRSSSFGRDQRLTNNPEFQRVFQKGRRSTDGCFTVLFCHNALARPRLGLAIAKRRIRKATGRNRLKRLVRESFRRAEASLPAVDIVVLAGPAAATADNRALFASLEKHWRRLVKQGEQQEQRGKR